MCKYLTTVLLSRPIFLEMLFMLNSPGGIVTVYAGILLKLGRLNQEDTLPAGKPFSSPV